MDAKMIQYLDNDWKMTSLISKTVVIYKRGAITMKGGDSLNFIFLLFLRMYNEEWKKCCYN